MLVRFHALGSVDLRGTKGEELRSVLVQPKRLALFAYLTLSNPVRLHRRDSLLALFWPEATLEQARRSLRQALHFLRHELGPDILVNRGDDEVGIEPGSVRCDVLEFERALDAGHPEEGLALYQGHLLEGFHASSVAPELEQWLEDERSRLRARAVDAAAALSVQAERSGNLPLAVQRLRELLRIEPGSEAALRRLMTLLERAGDRGGALRAYAEFSHRLAENLAARPSPELDSFAARLRSGRPVGPPAAPGPGGQAPVAGPLAASPAGLPSHRARWLAAAAALLLAVGALAILRLSDSPTTAAGTPVVLAVGALEDRTGADSLGSARVLRDLLATDLARVAGFQVVSQARMQELLVRLAGGEETRAALTRAAQSAGAAEVLEGELYRRSPDSLRLDVRRVTVATGVIRRSYTATGKDLFALVDRMSEQLAAEAGQPAPSPSLSGLTTTSLVARRFYEEGIRAFYQSDLRGALQLFRSALAEDSSFAMAAYFAARTAAAAQGTEYLPYTAQAVRMARHATERERLLIAVAWASVSNSPSLVAVAESLVRRFPLEPDAELALGGALVWSGDFTGAIPHFRRAAERDSLSLGTPASGTKSQPPCTACDALGNLVFAYTALDSGAAAERFAREHVRLQPRSVDAWARLAIILDMVGRSREALETWRTRQTLWQELYPGALSDDVYHRAQALIRAGEFPEADRLLAERVREGSQSAQVEATWWQVVSLRNQGRLLEALAVARRHLEVSGDSNAVSRLPEAQVLYELGRTREAVARFQAAALAGKSGPQLPPGAPDSAFGMTARSHVWHLTHLATALAAAGDTVRLARLADSVAALGARGAYGRDRRLHHHLHGLLLLARGRREEAAEEFSRAIYSPTIGYTRTNLELGRVLLALGRPQQAAAVLGPALRGDLQASNYYVTHAELHEALAQAFEAAGQSDSARVHYAWVAHAWDQADPPFRERAAKARAKARESR